MENLNDLAIQVTPFATAVTFSIGLVQIIKHADSDNKLARFYPFIGLIIGFGITYFLFGIDTIVSLATGLSVSGTYEVAKKTVLGVVEEKIPKNFDADIVKLPEPPPMGAKASEITL